MFEEEFIMAEQKKNYATKKKGKTEVDPFWKLSDIKNVIEWFVENNEWDAYLTTMFELLLGRRIGDTISLKWSDFYFENGRQKRIMDTVVEQKTGKTTSVPIGSMVIESIEKYTEATGVNPMDHYDEDIFEYVSKTAWQKRKNDPIYKSNSLEIICEYLGKDYSDKRKESIVSDFSKQKRYNSIGEYFYNEVERDEVLKWHADAYRKVFNKAVVASKVDYDVSTHSLRKSFGYWIRKIHPFDPDVLLSLQQLFSHSSVEQTIKYIGLSEEKNRMLIDDLNALMRDVMNGNENEIKRNMPVIAMKTCDMQDIFMFLIKSGDNIRAFVMSVLKELSLLTVDGKVELSDVINIMNSQMDMLMLDVDLYDQAMKMADEKRIA